MKKRRKKTPERKSKNKGTGNPYLFYWDPLFVPDNSDPLGLVGKLALCFKNGANTDEDDPLTSIEIKNYAVLEGNEIRWMYQQLVQPLGNIVLGEWYAYTAHFLRINGSEVTARFCINYTGKLPLIVTREPDPRNLHDAEQALTEFIVRSVKKKLRANYKARQQQHHEEGAISVVSNKEVSKEQDSDDGSS
jgi:hypothetical protein